MFDADKPWFFDVPPLLGRATARTALFDHLVGAQQNRWRYRKAKRLGDLVRNCTGRSPDFAPRRMRST
jgi:hypothetical protein